MPGTSACAVAAGTCASDAATTTSPSAVDYDRFAITSPSNGETLPTGQGGNVQVQLAIEPELQPGDRVQLRVDGKVSQSPMHTSVFALSQLERGELHNLFRDLGAPAPQSSRKPPVCRSGISRARSFDLEVTPWAPTRLTSCISHPGPEESSGASTLSQTAQARP